MLNHAAEYDNTLLSNVYFKHNFMKLIIWNQPVAGIPWNEGNEVIPLSKAQKNSFYI